MREKDPLDDESAFEIWSVLPLREKTLDDQPEISYVSGTTAMGRNTSLQSLGKEPYSEMLMVFLNP